MLDVRCSTELECLLAATWDPAYERLPPWLAKQTQSWHCSLEPSPWNEFNLILLRSADRFALLLQLHPLSVRLVMCPSAEGSNSQLFTALTFSYYTQLKLVGVLGGTPDDQELVTNLFLGDVGDGRMLENVGVCSNGGALQFAEAGRPCPFRYVAAGWGAGPSTHSAGMRPCILPGSQRLNVADAANSCQATAPSAFGALRTRLCTLSLVLTSLCCACIMLLQVGAGAWRC
jgi:hypothetical protein